MTFWIVRAGKHGEAEAVALKEGAAVVGWDDLPDLSPATDVEAMRALVTVTYPDDKPRTLANWAGQLFAFSHLIRPGDLIGLPLKGQPFYAFGEAVGPYRYEAGGPAGAYHRMPVRWLDQNAPRSAFDRDIQYSIGSLLTVFQPGAKDAEARVRRVLKGAVRRHPRLINEWWQQKPNSRQVGMSKSSPAGKSPISLWLDSRDMT